MFGLLACVVLCREKSACRFCAWRVVAVREVVDVVVLVLMLAGGEAIGGLGVSCMHSVNVLAAACIGIAERAV